MKEKDKFLINCDIFKRELADLQAEIEWEEETKNTRHTSIYWRKL